MFSVLEERDHREDRTKCRANIKLDLKIIRCKDVNWRQMTLVEGPIMCSCNYGNDLLGAIRGASHMTIKFSIRAFLYGVSHIFCSHSYVTILLMWCIIRLFAGLLFTGFGSQNAERREDNGSYRFEQHWAGCNNFGS